MNTPLDTATFENWMRQIMERFDRNEQLIASLTGKEFKEVKYLDGERLLDNQDLCELLNTSKRSIQRYRSSGTLKYQMLWHKVYYKESDVQEFLKTHFKEFEGKNTAKREKA
ncbi:helix-turn-helix domain-containing protein [Bacteroides xylanisolvens]|uniref:helix-turn-helix domain-containing protein n=1 Tax=Bacteroides xylanisolvens TaxID=371601 RepID=UPI0039B664E8